MRLGVAQPIVTRKIRQLEEQLGVALFTRHNRGAELTPAGELLAARAGGILMQVQQLTHEVRDQSAEVQGRISLGIAPSVGSVLGPHILDSAATRWPKLTIEFIEARSPELFKRVRDRDLALALLFDPPATNDDILSFGLLMERLHLVGPPGSLANLTKVSVKDLARFPLVLSSHGHIVRNILEDAFAEHGVPVTPVHEANSVVLLKAMVQQKRGYAVLTLGSLASEIASEQLVAVPLAQRGMSVALTLIVSRDSFKLRTVQLMSQLIAEEVQRLVKGGIWPGQPQPVRNRLTSKA